MKYSRNSIFLLILLLIGFPFRGQIAVGYSSQVSGKCTSGNSDSVKIAVLTDVHFLSADLTGEGDALAAYEKSTGRNVTDLHEVLDRVLTDLLKEEIDILLVTGDITNHGERQSHLAFIEKLTPLQESGTRIFVIPGNHDVNIPDAKAYKGKKTTPVESITKEEFAELYQSFGYGRALQRDGSSLSYLAEIDAHTWLLCFDTNRYDGHTTSSITGGRIHPKTMEWALNILREAGEKNIRVLGMMHHGLVEHMPYQNAFFSDYLIEDWELKADQLADAGLNVVFTGHFHSNDITLRTSPAGNTLYDVETASLTQYPFAYRIMNLYATGLSVDTRFITNVPGNPDLEEEYRQKLEKITRRVAEDRLIGLGVPIPEEMMATLSDLIVKLNTAHVRGDEKPDPELSMAIQAFASLLGDESGVETFSFDFPPEDNRVVIELDNFAPTDCVSREEFRERAP